MKFKIDGIEESSGKKVSATVTADDEKEAVKKLKDKGIYPTSVQPIHEERPKPIPSKPSATADLDNDGPQARHSHWQYRVVRASMVLESSKCDGSEAALYVQNLLNKYARDGWEFHGMETMTEETPPGCLAIFTREVTRSVFYMVVFKRWIEVQDQV